MRRRHFAAGIIGGPGTFAWLAFQHLQRAYGWTCRVQYFESADTLLMALAEGSIDVTCVAVQTSHSGFTPMLQQVLRNPPPGPIGEVVLPYDCTLYVREGHDLAQVRLVLGHRSLELASEWLRRHLPEARQEARRSTVEAAREVAQGDGHLAVVGSPALAQFAPGLRAAARGIDGGAVARWWALSRAPTCEARFDRAVVVGCSVSAHALAGLLATLLPLGLELAGLYTEPVPATAFLSNCVLLIGDHGADSSALKKAIGRASSSFRLVSAFRLVADCPPADGPDRARPA